jgi:DNA-binding NarL/FixJ family response regulator
MEEEDEAAVTLLKEFETDRAATLDDLVRVQNGRLHLGMRLGTLTQGLAGAEGVAEMVAGARDPVVRTSFWHAYAGALRTAAQYASALEAARNALHEIARFDLDFARAYVYVTQAGAFAGMATHDKALDVLDEIGRVASRTNDVYLQMNERMLRCRIHLLTGDVVEAVGAVDMAWPERGSSGQCAEFLAYRALATAMAGNTAEDPLETLRAAEQRSRENEASSLCMCVRALLTLDGDTTAASETIRTAFRIALAKRVLDPLIFAFRLDPRLSRLVQRDHALRPALSNVLKIVHGEGRSDANRPADFSTDVESLTPRERQVLPLLAEGKTNKEIATMLFLTEGTVKVHVRHILRKIGARSRTEAAIYTIKMQQQREGASASVQMPRPDQLHSPE